MEKPVANLRQFLTQHFDLEELRTLCFDLDVRYDNLRGEGLDAKARELVALMQRQGRLEDLVAEVRQWRPKAYDDVVITLPPTSWPERVSRRKWWVAIGAGGLIVPLVIAIALLFPSPISENEIIIIVADFEDRSKGTHPGIDAAEYIYQELVDEVKRDYITIRRLRQIVDSDTVESIGRRHGAKLVVWGWYDTLSITYNIERIITMPRPVSSEEGRHFLLSDLDKIEFAEFIVDCLHEKVFYSVNLMLGISEYLHQDYDSAIESLSGTLNSMPTNDKCSITPGEAHFYLGNIHYLKGSYETALTEYKRAAILENAKVYNNRGNVFFKMGAYQQALEDFSQAVELDPEYAIAFFNRGNTHYELGEYPEALSAYDQAITLAAENAQFYNNRGNAYYQVGKYDNALADYEKALELAPECAEAYHNSIVIHLNRGEFDQAVAACRVAMKHVLDNADIYYLCGVSLVERAMEFDHFSLLANIYMSAALVPIDKAIELSPKPEMYCERGRLFVALGKEVTAVADLEQCLEETEDPYWQKEASRMLKTCRESNSP